MSAQDRLKEGYRGPFFDGSSGGGFNPSRGRGGSLLSLGGKKARMAFDVNRFARDDRQSLDRRGFTLLFSQLHAIKFDILLLVRPAAADARDRALRFRHNDVLWHRVTAAQAAFSTGHVVISTFSGERLIVGHADVHVSRYWPWL